MITGAQIVAEARTWLDTPYVHQGRVKGVGVDCIGVPGMTGVMLGAEGAAEWRSRPEYHNYSPQPDPRLLLRGCNEFFDPVQRRSEIRVGDIAIMRWEDEPMHFALMTEIEEPYVLHALRGVGKVCEHRADAQWQSQIMRVYRFRGMA